MGPMNAAALRTLRQRLAYQRAELSECTTVAMAKCVLEAIDDTERQIAALGAGK